MSRDRTLLLVMATVLGATGAGCGGDVGEAGVATTAGGGATTTTAGAGGAATTTTTGAGGAATTTTAGAGGAATTTTTTGAGGAATTTTTGAGGAATTTTGAGGAAPSCGDGACGAGETCQSCVADCGPCGPTCGDGACDGGETCQSCAADCGPCGPTCGDGACDGGETCQSCAADCQSPSCPASPVNGYSVGDGLLAIDACAFPMSDTGSWAARAALVADLATKLPTQPLSALLGDLNRTGTKVASVPGLGAVKRGVKWEAGDQSVAYWYPQGLTGSGDGLAGKLAGKDVVLSSWYYKQSGDPGSKVQKGVRIAVLDPSTATYRFALLVEPYASGGTTTWKAVEIHAGGLAWWGDRLYVADTGAGLRVFDLAHVFTVATDADTMGFDAGAGVWRAHKYKYAIPQIGAYQRGGACKPVFSFVALDRASSPPSLVTGEYDAASHYGRVFRWPLDPGTGLLPAGTFAASEAFFLGQTHVQGALPYAGRWLLSSSAPAGGGGALYRVAPGASKTFAWSDSPEDLYLDPSTGELWGQSEATGARYVFAVTASTYQ